MKGGAQNFGSTLFLALIVIGIGGLSWSAFRAGGWLEHLLGGVLEEDVRHPILVVPTVGALLLGAMLLWRGGLSPGKGGRSSRILSYGLALCGIYYLYHWFLA